MKIKKLHPSAKPPIYATPGAACFDLFATDVDGDPDRHGWVERNEPVTCGTGLAFEVPAGYVMLIFSRSGHAFNNDVRLANCVGVIDSDYRGEVKIKLTCDAARSDLKVRPGDRIAQAMLMPVQRIEFEVVDSLSTTERGAGGFGSTGAA